MHRDAAAPAIPKSMTGQKRAHYLGHQWHRVCFPCAHPRAALPPSLR